jgi:ribosomal protein S8
MRRYRQDLGGRAGVEACRGNRSQAEVAGYVADVQKSKKPYHFEVTLAYDERGNHKIHGVKRVSKPGRRLYAPSAEAHT